jgi:shikimate dehydrogenase
MHELGVIGKSLDHSFSPSFFKKYIGSLNLSHSYRYRAFPLQGIEDLPTLIEEVRPLGLNVTIPFKRSVLDYVDHANPLTLELGAANVLHLSSGRIVAHNTDVEGFEESLLQWSKSRNWKSAWVLGSGGASEAVQYVLKKLSIPFEVISRNGDITYQDLKSVDMKEVELIINCTPLGMYPDIESLQPLPYDGLTDRHGLVDLTYNPPLTAFLKKGQQKGCPILNGQKMLEIQALASWKIWNEGL